MKAWDDMDWWPAAMDRQNMYHEVKRLAEDTETYQPS